VNQVFKLQFVLLGIEFPKVLKQSGLHSGATDSFKKNMNS